MPSIFSSRRRGSSNPPLDRGTMNAAIAAAGAAALRRPPSSASLSNAAAAAALRSHTTSPEPVANLQTKRMVRRGSVSSTGSGSVIGSGIRGGNASRASIQRNNSNSSMTERTFRSPSPSVRSNGAMSPAYGAPPVPALPRGIAGSGHKRASSLEPPQRVMSPTPPRGKRGASVDKPPANSRLSKRLSNVFEAEEMEKLEQMEKERDAISSAASAKKYTHGTGSWYSSPSGNKNPANARPSTSDGTMRRKADNHFVAQDVMNAASKPGSKRQVSAGNASGNHLARANNVDMDGRQVTTYDTQDAVMVYDPNTRTFVSKPRDQPREPEPQSPTLPTGPALQPGSWDPHTRTVVPASSQGNRVISAASMTSAAGILKPQKQRPSVPAVDTTLQPPPRNPRRLSPSPSPSPTSPRAPEGLHKQPSVVREDTEAEETAAAQMPTSKVKDTGRLIQTSAGPAKAYVVPSPSSHKRSASLDVPHPSIEGGQRGRNVSSSPARSAHFSPSPIMEAHKHVPPPRELSPVKSAMKHSHSPGSSLRAASPTTTFSTANSAPPGDTSDTMSLASQDGFSSKKKKSVRVSFDERPEEIHAGGANAKPRAIATMSRDKSPAVEDDMEEIMQPRPALPSFGSVRRTSGRGPEMPEKVTEMAPEREGISSDHGVGGILASAGRRISVDEKDLQDASASAPVPPEVTSKEAASELTDESDGESSFRSGLKDNSEKPSVIEKDDSEPRTRDFATQSAARLAPNGVKTAVNANENADVPAINLLPPTPGETPGDGAKELGDQIESDGTSPRQKASFEMSVPGSWSREEPDDKSVQVPSVPSSPVPEQADLQHHTNVTASGLPHIDLDAIDEDTDDSGAFSDAAEDLSDIDDGGFASLDAIVSSPVGPSPADKEKTPDYPESPTAKQAAIKHTRRASGAGSGDWTQATAYWSRLSRQQREQIEREHLSDDDDEPRPMPTKPKKKKSALKNAGAATIEDRQPKASTAMPKTMRARPGPAPADNDVHLRKSMRPNGNDGSSMRDSMRSGSSDRTTMRTSMRSGPPSQHNRQSSMDSSSGRLPSRPASAASFSAAAGGSAMKTRRARADSAGTQMSQDSSFPRMQADRMSQQPAQRQSAVPPPGAYTSKMQKKVTDDSDSESSFRKKRGSAATNDSGRYTMKRSMRAGSVGQASIDMRPSSPPPGAKRGGGAFSIRSLSPAGRSWGKDRGDKLRESLRSPSVDAGPKRTTLRGANGPKGGSTMRSTPRASAPSGGSRFKSRFGADSDDEDDRPRRSFFNSRFADSDDEDEPSGPRHIPADLTPVRGIPRRRGQYDGDSTDLEEEDEDDDPRKSSRKRNRQAKPGVPDSAEVDKAMAAARRNLGISAPETKEGNMLSKGSLRKSSAQQADGTEPKSRPEGLTVETATPEKKKRGFMGSILRRNRASQQSVSQMSPVLPVSPTAAASPQSGQVSPRVARADETAAPASPSTGKLLRRSSQQPPKFRRGDSTFSNATAPPASGDQRDEWNIPPVPKIPNGARNNARPETSDGVNPEAIRLARTMRPDLAPRAQSGVGFAGSDGRKVRMAPGAKEEDGGGVYSARTGRKKKFGMLRRAFGLND